MSDLEEKARHPLQFVRFFETADVGIEVAPAAKGVTVHGLQAWSQAAQAGAQQGDIITALDGVQVDSPVTFRRLVCQALARERSTLRIQRDGSSVDVVVSFRCLDEMARDGLGLPAGSVAPAAFALFCGQPK